MKGAFVPLDVLEKWLDRMESDWYQIDDEWGPTEGGLESDIANEFEVIIPQLRKYIDIAKKS